jgi:hypothetical protein
VDINQLLGLTRIVQESCQGNRLKFPFRGKEIFIRDVVGKAVFWLNKVKDVGDIAVNVDPMHAGLPCEYYELTTSYPIVAIQSIACFLFNGRVPDHLEQII